MRFALWALLVLGVVLLVVAALIVIPILTHSSGGSSGQDAPAGFATSVEATGEDGRTRTLTLDATGPGTFDPAHTRQGDRVIVEGSGFDSSVGIYVSFCQIPEPGDRPGPCLGGIPEGAVEGEIDADAPLESAWVTNHWAWRSFATHQYLDAEAGTFTVELTVPSPYTDELDCTVAACGIFTRADHTASSDRVQDLYLPVEFAD